MNTKKEKKKFRKVVKHREKTKRQLFQHIKEELGLVSYKKRSV